MKSKEYEVEDADVEIDDFDDNDCPNCGAKGEGWTSSCMYCHQPDPRIDDVEND